ncbi:MAG TPA: DUF5671 domain-containing protein [Candidatus Dormibacteraeota bacterium]|nr:DUF5671 domain-containing protein [Candidatus Dormibacteraeota bacterium]
MILRRLYLYLVSIAALGVLAFGLISLGDTILLFAFNRPDAQYSRSSLAGYTAMVVVAFPVWAVHQWFARRFAHRDSADRGSAIRRLYLYLACAGSAIGAAFALSSTVAAATQQQLDAFAYDPLAVAQSAWATAVLLAIWVFHYGTAARDRALVGEQGSSATLRRWYMYLALLVGLLMMLSGAQTLIQVAWVKAVQSLDVYTPMSSSLGELVGGALLWGFHARALATRFATDDRRSTLRAVEGFIAVGVSIVAALIGASQILYYGLARALGVDNPGGLGNNLLAGLAQPASYVLVYGVAWFLIRRRLSRDAASGEAARQAGIRRLYTNLVALVSMGAFAVGAAGLLGTLAELAEAPLIGVGEPSWRDPISLWLTLLIVGGAVWLAHWRQVPWLEERLALSRRLYVWAALLASVLAVLGGGIALLYVVFQQLFSAQPRLNDTANLAFGQALAVILVAAAVGIYHWRVMRSDAAARPAKIQAAGEPAETQVVIAPPAPTGREVPSQSAPDGRLFELSVVGATEDDVHQALANLPPKASYKLIPSDHTA